MTEHGEKPTAEQIAAEALPFLDEAEQKRLSVVMKKFSATLMYGYSPVGNFGTSLDDQGRQELAVLVAELVSKYPDIEQVQRLTQL